MMSRRTWGLSLFSSMAALVGAQAKVFPASPADDVEALRHMAREFTEGFNSGDVDRIMNFYSDTYVDINLRKPTQTWEERRAYYADILSQRKFKIDVQPDEILVKGDLALIRGTLFLLPTEQSDQPKIERRYLEVAERVAGSWKVIWGMDGPVND